MIRKRYIALWDDPNGIFRCPVQLSSLPTRTIGYDFTVGGIMVKQKESKLKRITIPSREFIFYLFLCKTGKAVCIKAHSKKSIPDYIRKSLMWWSVFFPLVQTRWDSASDACLRVCGGTCRMSKEYFYCQFQQFIKNLNFKTF